MSQPASSTGANNRFSVKKSGSPSKSKSQDKTTLISASEDGDPENPVVPGVKIGNAKTSNSFYGSVMKSKRKSGRLLIFFSV